MGDDNELFDLLENYEKPKEPQPTIDKPESADIKIADTTVNTKNGKIIPPKKPRHSFKKGESGNPKGRKKNKEGSSFGEVIQYVFESAVEADGDITWEKFVKKMIQRAYDDNDSIAMRFILAKTPAPKAQVQVSQAQEFELYDLSQETEDENIEDDFMNELEGDLSDDNSP